MPPDHRDYLSPRRHPHRLRRDAYQQVNQPVFFSLCTARRRPFLTEPRNAQAVVRALDVDAPLHRSFVIAYCVMPDHFHFVACVAAQGGDVMSFAEAVKKTTARDLHGLGVALPVWQRSLWDRHARKAEDLGEQIDYILLNPVRRGLCSDPDEWPYSEFRGVPWEP